MLRLYWAVALLPRVLIGESEEAFSQGLGLPASWYLHLLMVAEVGTAIQHPSLIHEDPGRVSAAHSPLSWHRTV